jgi:hypothetical protein
MQVPEHVGQRERVLRPERQQQPIVGRRGLQLEVELAAEPLAQREAPRAVEPAAERRVQEELHAARLVEEPLEDECLLRRKRPEQAAGLAEIEHDLERRGAREARFVREPADRGLLVIEPAVELAPEIAHGPRQLVAARGRFAEPERDGRRLAVGVGDADDAALDGQDAPRAVAELEDVALDALDDEVLVHGADEEILGLEHHAIIGVLGDRAA